MKAVKSFVIDASVVIKWIFPEKIHENNLPQALHLLKANRQGALKIIQPLHWLVETMAVVTRLQPKIAKDTVSLLDALDFPIIDVPEVYHIACELSARLKHHLFDTLYHAVALYDGNASLVTADEQYYQRASKEGSIIRLADFSIFNEPINTP